MSCKKYWEIPKKGRILYGLRHEVGLPGYSGREVIEMCDDIVRRAMRGAFPFQGETVGAFKRLGDKHEFRSTWEVLDVVEPLVAELEDKLEAYDVVQRNA